MNLNKAAHLFRTITPLHVLASVLIASGGVTAAILTQTDTPSPKGKSKGAARLVLPARASTGQLVQRTSAPAVGEAGFVTYINPNTGKPGAPAPGVPLLELSGQLDSPYTTSDQGLQEVRSQLPNGGVLVDLRGRFQHGLAIGTDGRGQFTSSCLTGVPQTNDLVSKPASARAKE